MLALSLSPILSTTPLFLSSSFFLSLCLSSSSVARLALREAALACLSLERAEALEEEERESKEVAEKSIWGKEEGKCDGEREGSG